MMGAMSLLKVTGELWTANGRVTVEIVVKNSQKLDRFFTAGKLDRGGRVGFGLTRFDWVGLSWTERRVGRTRRIGRICLGSVCVFMPAKGRLIGGTKSSPYSVVDSRPYYMCQVGWGSIVQMLELLFQSMKQMFLVRFHIVQAVKESETPSVAVIALEKA